MFTPNATALIPSSTLYSQTFQAASKWCGPPKCSLRSSLTYLSPRQMDTSQFSTWVASLQHSEETHFLKDIHTEKGRDIGRGRNRFPTGIPTRSQDHDLLPKADAQSLSHPGAPEETLLNILFAWHSFFKDFSYLFMRDTEIERGRDTGRGRSRLHAGSPM